MALAEFIRSVATRLQYPVYGDIDISIRYEARRYTPEGDRLFPGTVYGLAVRLAEEQRRALYTEAVQKRVVKLDKLDRWKPLDAAGDLYPLYWGKDWYSGSRLYAHLTGHKNNNSLRLCEVNLAHLVGKDLFYASIRVDHHEDLENYLHVHHPDLLKTTLAKGTCQ